MRLRNPAFLLSLALFCLASAHAADVPPATSTAAVPQTLDLGSVHVEGKIQVAQVLATIKQALKAPDSTDPKHRNDLVCRLVRDLADPRTYLDCATNSNNQQRRNSTQMARMAAVCTSQKCDSAGDMTAIAHTLVGNQPGERLHVMVKPHDFRELLDSVTAAPAASTAPAAATAAGATGHD
jgi:hypothetical protein